MFVTNNNKIKRGEVLGFIESTTDYQAVIEVEKTGKTFRNLGELQPAYQIFDQAQTQYFIFKKQGFYYKRKILLQKDLSDLQRLANNLEEQKSIQQEDLKIAENEYLVQKKLAEQKVIAPLELKREESKYIAKKLPLKNLESSLINNSTAQTAKIRELMDLEKTISEQESLYQQARNTFKSAIDAWKQRYVLIASADGILSFSGLIQEKMQVIVNQELFNISSNNLEHSVKYLTFVSSTEISNLSLKYSLNNNVGIIDTIFALPHLSPKPFKVP